MSEGKNSEGIRVILLAWYFLDKCVSVLPSLQQDNYSFDKTTASCQFALIYTWFQPSKSPFGHQLFLVKGDFFTSQAASSKILGTMATKVVTTWKVGFTL